MSQNWQDQLRFVRDQFSRISLLYDLRHGIIYSEGREPTEGEWRWVEIHEAPYLGPPLALTEWRDGAEPVYGKFFGNAEGLSYFRDCGDAAFRCLLQSSDYRRTIEDLGCPEQPRDCSNCWLAILYRWARENNHSSLRARLREAVLSRIGEPRFAYTGPDGIDVYEVSDVPEASFTAISYAFLETNVLLASAAAVDLLLQGARRWDGSSNPLADEWLTASAAVALACQKGYDITLDWIHKRKDRIRTRGRLLPGTHKLEVEQGSFALVLLKEAKRKTVENESDGDTDTPDQEQQEEIQARMREEEKRKKRGRNP
jgi:hypothetical protein